MMPTLGDESPPSIRIGYRESSDSTLFDIAQSGAGLHTFLSLAQLIRQSRASILLLDEPDSHLHASQQDTVVQLLSRVAAEEERQVILATHSPEIIARVPDSCLRWLEPGNPVAAGAERADLWDRLGASADAYLSKSDFPEIVVYVEGKKDKPVIERLIHWCRKTHSDLPTTAVVPHKHGHFKEATIQGIARVASDVGLSTNVVGIRDLDWIYDDCQDLLKAPPADEVDLKTGDGCVLLTLPCKELENLLCDAEWLYDAIDDDKVSKEWIQTVIEEESRDEELVTDWRYQVIGQIRKRFDAHIQGPTLDRRADEIFSGWRENPTTRARLVRGKGLLGRIRKRIQEEHGIGGLSATRSIDKGTRLHGHWIAVAQAIFPGIKDDPKDLSNRS